MWALSLPAVDLTAMDGRGLLACLPPPWFGALALAVLAPGLLLGVRPVGRAVEAAWTTAMLAGLGVLITVLYATTSVVYPVPRYYATYKHMAVVEYFLAGNPIDRSIDIYQNWPGFFLLAAGVHRVTGIPVLGLAQWAEPFFAALVALAVVWAVGGVRGRRQVRWTAALLVTTANWVGQNYFSPQALAFPLSLLVVGMLLRMVPSPMGEQVRLTLVGRRLRRAPRIAGAVHAFWGRRPGALVCLTTYAVIVVSHQLSPVIVLGQAIGLAVVFRMSNAWLPLAFAALEAGWLVQSWSFVSRRFQIVQVQGVENIRPPSDGPVAAMAWAQTLAWASPALMAMLGLLTLVAFARLSSHLRDRPELRWVLAPVLFGLVPVAVLIVQPYGNEGIFRAFLFALPWSALLIARGVVLGTATWRSGRGRLRFALPPLFVLLWLPTSFAPELDNYVAASDVRSVRWASTHTPAGSAFVTLTGGAPIPMTADYARRRFDWEQLNQPFTTWPEFTGAAPADPDAVVAFAASAASWYPASDVYLFLGPGQAAHARYHGELGAVRWADVETGIAASGWFALVHRDGESSVWHYLGATAT